MVASGELEAFDLAGELRLSWSELVTFALEVIGQEAIEEALGTNLERALPELVRLAELRVRSPRHEIAALQQIAARDGLQRRHGRSLGAARRRSSVGVSASLFVFSTLGEYQMARERV